MAEPERLPGGGKAWFVRQRRGISFTMNPCSTEGWLVIAAFVMVNLLSVLVLLPRPTASRWVAWTIVEILAAVLLVLIAYRTSAPGWREK